MLASNRATNGSRQRLRSGPHGLSLPNRNLIFLLQTNRDVTFGVHLFSLYHFHSGLPAAPRLVRGKVEEPRSRGSVTEGQVDPGGYTEYIVVAGHILRSS